MRAKTRRELGMGAPGGRRGRPWVVMGVEARGGAGWGRKRAGDPRAGCYRAGRAACASKRRKTARPRGCVAISATSPTPSGRVTAAALRPSRVLSRSVASRPASSLSKARKTRGQPRSGGDALNALGAQGSAGGEAPSGEGEPVEEPLGQDRPRRRRAEPAEPEHRLWAGQGLEAWHPVLIDGSPPCDPVDEPA